MLRFPIPAFLALTAAWAQSPDYFPLQVGNQWIYRSATDTQTRQIEVTGTQTVNGAPYYIVTKFAGPSALLRRVADRLVRYDPASDRDVVVLDFGAVTGEAFTASFDPCTTQGTVTDKNGAYSGGIGSFDGNVLVVKYSGLCADAGIQEDRFLPYVGLVSRTEQSIAGPRRFDLVYSNNGGFNNITAPQVSFALNLDSGAYRGGSSFLARLTLRNNAAPITLEWFSLQRFDLLIFDVDGNEVYRWSDGMAFPQLASSESFQGERNWVVSAALQDKNKVQIPPGHYVMQAYLTTRSPLAKKYSASLGFDVN